MLPRLVQRALWWFLSMVIDGLGHLNNLSVHLFTRCPGVVEDSGMFSRGGEWRSCLERRQTQDVSLLGPPFTQCRATPLGPWRSGSRGPDG